MATLKLETNVEEIDIERNGKHLGTVSIDLTDVGLLNRLRKAAEKSQTEYNAMQERAGSLSGEEMLDEMERVDALIRALVDEALQSNVSDIVFGDLYCFTSKNGVTLLEQFLNGVLDMFGDRTKAESEKLDKHLAKYK